MRKLIAAATLGALLFLGFATKRCLAQESPAKPMAELEGEWIGGWQVNGERVSVKAQFTNRPVAFHDVEVSYPSGAITLSGTLSIPAGKGPHPALLLITGSGKALRDQFGDWPHKYAALGIATLVYDKRGCGASTGRFHDLLPIDELANDALAGIEYLKSRADIDPKQIGIVAASQGGWVAPVVASRSPNVSLMVLISAPTLSVADNGLYEIDNDLRAEGFSDTEVSRSRSLNQLFNNVVLKRGEGWAQLRAELDRSRNEKWFQSARLPGPLPETPAAANLAWLERLRLFIGFDPMPIWKAQTIPVLALYGGKDKNVPGNESARMLRAALKTAGNHQSTIKIYQNADHHLKVVGARNQNQLVNAPGLENLIHGWLLKHLKP